jgi:hypothetical protein
LLAAQIQKVSAQLEARWPGIINRSERRQALEANVHGGHRASGHIDGERTGIGSALQPVGLADPRNVEGGDFIGRAKMNSMHGKWQSMFLAEVRGVVLRL